MKIVGTRRRTAAIAAGLILLGTSMVMANQQRDTAVPGGVEGLTTARSSARRVLFELRLAEVEPVRGLTFEGTIRGSERKIHLHYTVLLSNSDVRTAAVVETAGRFDVALMLAAEATQKVMEATTKHKGRPLAVILDGELVAAVDVRETLSNRIVFGANFTADEARRIAAGLERW